MTRKFFSPTHRPRGSVSGAQRNAAIKNALQRDWSHDPLELGSDGDADLAQRRLDSAKLFYSSYSRLFPRVGYQPAVRVAVVGSKAMAMQHPRRCYVADRRGAGDQGATATLARSPLRTCRLRSALLGISIACAARCSRCYSPEPCRCRSHGTRRLSLHPSAALAPVKGLPVISNSRAT